MEFIVLPDLTGDWRRSVRAESGVLRASAMGWEPLFGVELAAKSQLNCHTNLPE